MENNLRQFKIDIQTGLILAKDERVSEWTISIEDPFLRFHDAMHSLLVNFLNATDLSPVGAVMPMRYAQIPGSKKLNIAVEAAKTLDVKTPHLSRVASQALSSSRDWANAIAEGYGILMDNAFQRDNFARHIVRSEIDRNEWMEIVSRRNYRPLSSFIDYLLNLNLDGISGFWLHGSLATMDYLPGYSDCDATVIINKGSSTDPDALLCMRKELSRVSCALHNIDLLQHHGLFVVSELDLRSYHQSFFPLG